MNLVPSDDPLLRRIAAPVENFTGISDLTRDMFTFIDGVGIGLAAPQIGISLRVIVISESGVKMACVNPSWSHVKGEQTCIEKCLSVPGVEAKITRSDRIRVSYWTPDGKPKSHYLMGMKSTVFQHEVDHLNGILIE